MWFDIGSTVIVYNFGVYARKVVCAYVCIYFFAASFLNMLGKFLNVVTWLTLLVLNLVL